MGLVILAGCTTGGTLGAPPEGSASGSTGPLTHLTVGLGYIPSVQFAPFYLAAQAGYYRAAGLDVEFQNKIDPDLIVLVGQGVLDIGIGDGTSVVPAVSQGAPIRYVATLYAQSPNVVFAKAGSGITTAADLKGKRIGTPGKFGSNWIHLQALLASAGFGPSDVQIVVYADFGQATALGGGAVDAATGYSNNEPVQLARDGIPVTIVCGPGMVELPGPGLVTGTTTLEQKPAALRAFISATLRAIREVAADPETGLTATFTEVPELAGDREGQLAILQATIALWQSPYTQQHGLGSIDHAAWDKAATYISSLPEHLVVRPVASAELVSDGLLTP